MPTYDASTADCLVYTYKDGLLSRVAHDLALRVTVFSIVVGDDRSIRATFDPRSLRVECARKSGVDAPEALDASDRRDIERNVVKHVLRPDRFSEICFVSTEVVEAGDAARIRGTLTLHGVSREIALDARRTRGRWVAETRLHQPDFGIEPFRAALGTLKIKAGVDVSVSLPPS